jgi:hypothetical protein
LELETIEPLERERARRLNFSKFARLVCVFTALTIFTDIRAPQMRSCVLCIAALAAPSPCAAFYLPGVAPRDYLPGEKVELKVNKLSSTKTQLVR